MRPVALLLVLILAGAGPPAPAADPPAAFDSLQPLILPDLEHLEDVVGDQLRHTQSLLCALLEKPAVSAGELAAAFGETGRLYHAYELIDPAATCYGNAARLEPADFRWVYLRSRLEQQTGSLPPAVPPACNRRRTCPTAPCAG